MSPNKNKLVMALDIGGTTIKSGLVDSLGRIIYEIKVPSQALSGSTFVLENIKKVIDKMLQYAEKNVLSLKSIGISTAGVVDPEKGEIIFATGTFKGWQGVSIKENINKYLKLPVYIENDAHAAGWGEKYFGVARNVNDFVMLTLGTGLGGSIFTRGKLYTGSSNFAGLIGQMNIGFRCIGDNKKDFTEAACLEDYISANGMSRMANEIASEYKESFLAKIISENNGKISPKEIYIAYKNGDKLASEVIRRMIIYLGTGIITLLYLLNPELIVLSGGLSNMKEDLLVPLRKHVREHCPEKLYKNIKIKLSQNLENCGFIGAAAIAFSKGIPRI